MTARTRFEPIIAPFVRRATISSFFLATWFALIGADRIDFAGGAASFKLTPFIVLTPIVAICELIRRWRHRSPVNITGGVAIYFALASALLAIAVTSSVLSLQLETSAPRVALLVIDVVAALTIALLAGDRPDLLRILATGATFILPFYIFADIAETRWLLGTGPELLRLGTLTLHFDALQAFGFVARFPGLVGDANRAGYVLAVYWSVIARGESRPWRRRFGLGLTALLIVGTLSRSTLLAILAASFVGLTTRSRPPKPKVIAAIVAVVAVAVALILSVPKLQRIAIAVAATPQASRISPTEGSAKSHVVLIQRGLEEGASSIPTSLIGLGYGNAYLVLQDLFPDNKRYGNFHSLFVSVFAEMGIFALVITLAILLTPVILGGPWRPLAAGAVTFNIFYQTTAEPIFWFVVTMAWLTLTVRKRQLATEAAAVNASIVA